jgi:serine/threonine protein kinase
MYIVKAVDGNQGVLKTSDEHIEKEKNLLLHESDILAKLNHPNIVSWFGLERSTYYCDSGRVVFCNFI